MGWGNCGHDKLGRPIGYYHLGTCDHPGCNKPIDRGLDYACGGMHGNDEYSCDKYFCHDHLRVAEFKDGSVKALCLVCEETAEREGELADDDSAPMTHPDMQEG